MAIARREDSVGCKRARISSVPAGIPLTGGVPPGACCGTTNRCHHSWPADAGMAGAGTAGAGTAGAGTAGAGTAGAGMGRVGMVRAGAGEAGGGAAYHDDGAAGACGGPAGRSHQFGTPGEVEDSTFIPYGGKNIMIRPSYGFAQLHNNRSLMWSAMNMGPPPEGYYRGMGPPGFPVDRSPCGDLDYFGLEEAAGKCVSGGAGDAGERPAGVASTAGPPSWPPAGRTSRYRIRRGQPFLIQRAARPEDTVSHAEIIVRRRPGVWQTVARDVRPDHYRQARRHLGPRL